LRSGHMTRLGMACRLLRTRSRRTDCRYRSRGFARSLPTVPNPKTGAGSTSTCRQSQVNALHVRHIIYIDQAHSKSERGSGHDPENHRASPSPDGMRAKPHGRGSVEWPN
jgi:hypothetical protein